MISHPWGEEIARRLRATDIVPHPRTVYFTLAEELCSMAASYRDDGEYFLSIGDTTNALAAFSYALGWLDEASCLGLVTIGVSEKQWLFSHVPVPVTESGRLEEKVERYGTMLSAALANVSCVTEGGTCIRGASDRILCACHVLKGFGNLFRSSGRPENALGSYSYAHAWLDAGVRAGLFCVVGRHELFAV
ncbi:MAG TPA: DUF357 domain-containing protein [Methanolinea sp.]|nr:DUF357 domain-containing protein [Methanolinea sp.]